MNTSVLIKTMKLTGILVATVVMQGCIGTIIGAAAEVVEAGVEITGAAVEGVVDVVTPDDDDDDDEVEKDTTVDK